MHSTSIKILITKVLLQLAEVVCPLAAVYLLSSSLTIRVYKFNKYS